MRLANKVRVLEIEKARVPIIQRDRYMPADILVSHDLPFKKREESFPGNAFLPVCERKRLFPLQFIQGREKPFAH